MRAQKLVARVRQPGKELGTPNRIETRLRRDHRAQCIGFKLEFLGKPPRAKRRALLGHRLGRCRVKPECPCKRGAKHRTLPRLNLRLRDMAEDVVCRLVPHDKGKLVGVARLLHQRPREPDHRPSPAVFGQKGVGRLPRPDVDKDQEIAAPPTRAAAADVHRDGCYAIDHRLEALADGGRRQGQATHTRRDRAGLRPLPVNADLASGKKEESQKGNQSHGQSRSGREPRPPNLAPAAGCAIPERRSRPKLEPMSEHVTVIYNGRCPICAREIAHYRARAERAGAPLDFADLGDADLSRFDLTPDQAARRLYVVEDGELHSGIDAFVRIWKRLPGLRWAARAARLPIVGAALDLLYNRVAAPWLYRRHLKRTAGSA